MIFLLEDLDVISYRLDPKSLPGKILAPTPAPAFISAYSSVRVKSVVRAYLNIASVAHVPVVGIGSGKGAAA
jgi:hypothetical protein